MISDNPKSTTNPSHISCLSSHL